MNDMSNATIGYMSPTQGIRLRWGLWKTPPDLPGNGVASLRQGRISGKIQETAADLINRGFDVYSFDWRGQGLSSRMLPNRQKGFVKTYEDYLEDLDFFIQTINDARRQGTVLSAGAFHGGTYRVALPA